MSRERRNEGENQRPDSSRKRSLVRFDTADNGEPNWIERSELPRNDEITSYSLTITCLMSSGSTNSRRCREGGSESR